MPLPFPPTGATNYAIARASEVASNITELAKDPSDRVIVRINGKDYGVVAISTGYDGILGNNIVLEAVSLNELL